MNASTPVGSLAVFRVEGMTCQNCARHVREAAEGVAGVSRATVDLGHGRLTLRWKPDGEHSSEAVREAVGRAGFVANLVEGESPTGQARAPKRAGEGWQWNVWFGGVVTVQLMVCEWVFGLGHARAYGWVAFALALPIQIVGGARFYRGAWAQARRGGASMDTLVALGSSAAFVYSVWVLFGKAPAHVYFMESSAIITLISLGHWLEALASERAAGAIRALLGLAPDRTRRWEADGSEVVVAVSELLPGDLIVLQPGDRVPVDGEVIRGRSSVDESMLTGEPKAIEKEAGAKVFTGTANLDGRLVVRVESTGESTVLARIVDAVDRAQNSRARIQRLADRVSAVFVPVVVLLAIFTAAAWAWMPEVAAEWHAWMGRFLWTTRLPESSVAAAVIHATSVLIVACPCAMGLATPVAIMAGANAAAVRGILIRDGIALEKAGRIDTVVFDKTGTLTVGGLQVRGERDFRPEGERGESLRTIASGVARGSRHPVALALATEREDIGEARAPGSRPARFPGIMSGRLTGASGPGLFGAGGAGGGGGWTLRRDLVFQPKGRRVAKWIDWRELRGRGIEARRSGEESVVYRLGSLSWLEECGVGEAAAVGSQHGTLAPFVTRVGVSAGMQLLGVFDLQDQVRPEARAVVETLRKQGHEVYLLTGDAWGAAESAAKETGIDASRVMASVKPDDKARAIEKLQAGGRRVAFVGDGMNDGPALARADLGIAMSRATDVARESADIVLLRPGLAHVLEALGLARATLRTIRQNLFWAFFYNAAAVPLAMLGFFTPVVSAAAMGLSDLLVVGNALRLRRAVGSGLGELGPGESADIGRSGRAVGEAPDEGSAVPREGG